MREYGERLGLVVVVFEFGQIDFPWLTLADDQHGGFGKRPAQMDIADLVARRPEPFVARFPGSHPELRQALEHTLRSGLKQV